MTHADNVSWNITLTLPNSSIHRLIVVVTVAEGDEEWILLFALTEGEGLCIACANARTSSGIRHQNLTTSKPMTDVDLSSRHVRILSQTIANYPSQHFFAASSQLYGTGCD